MTRLYLKLLLLTYLGIQSHAMMIRNEALLSKMVSDFQKDNMLAAQQHQQQQQQQQQQQHPQQHPQQQQQSHQRPQNVLAMMQNVLCKNFPTVPCSMIVEDETLKNLMQRSIQQLKYKKLSMEKTTQTPAGYHLTLFPTINSEDLNNFLQVSDTGYFIKKLDKSHKRHKKRTTKLNTDEDREREPKKRSSNVESKRTTLYNGRKKIKKFYPHKIKYKDKVKGRPDFGDYSEEKLSMSVEIPDMHVGGQLEMNRNRDIMNFKADTDDAEDSPIWRIDYLKHGEPGLNVFGNEPDRLKEKLVKTGPNVILPETMAEPSARQDVLHPDVYIKKNYIRKNGGLTLD